MGQPMPPVMPPVRVSVATVPNLCDRGHHMLLRGSTRHTRSNFFLLAFLLLSLSLACDGLAVGKPSTSAPGSTGSLQEFWEACEERKRPIREWEDREARKAEDSWVEGERGLVQAVAKAESVKEEARALRSELMDNCMAKARRDYGWEGN